MHLALQTTPLEQFAWGDFAKHILRLDDNDNGIEDWGAWLKGLWEGTGLAEAVSGQIENEVVHTRCNSTEARKMGRLIVQRALKRQWNFLNKMHRLQGTTPTLLQL